jgi:hypothetical protein
MPAWYLIFDRVLPKCTISDSTDSTWEPEIENIEGTKHLNKMVKFLESLNLPMPQGQKQVKDASMTDASRLLHQCSRWITS